MTANEFKNNWLNGFELDVNQIEDLMIEFAKYHVEQVQKVQETICDMKGTSYIKK